MIAQDVRSYDELLAVLRSRIAELGTTMETLDEVAGLPLRYASKLFAPNPIKTLGKISLGPTLGVLGLKLVVTEDAEMFARIRQRLAPRKNARGRMAARGRGYVLKESPELARFLQRQWVLSTSARQRRRWATQGAEIRWARVRRGRRAG